MPITMSDVTAYLDERYPREWAADWDAVGTVCGRGEREISRVLFAVDCVAETVAQARELDAGLLVTHHPLLLRGVTSLSPDTYKGALLHTLIESGVGMYVAHTNADSANPGVSDALAHRCRLRDLRPLVPAVDGVRGIGRIGQLPEPMTLARFTQSVNAALPGTAWGVRAAGDPDRVIHTVAVCGGAGDSYLAQAAAAGVDAYLTADLRHHPASEAQESPGPALIDAAHWATERPWLDMVAADVHGACGIDTVVSDRITDPWTLAVSAPGTSQ